MRSPGDAESPEQLLEPHNILAFPFRFVLLPPPWLSGLSLRRQAGGWLLIGLLIIFDFTLLAWPSELSRSSNGSVLGELCTSHGDSLGPGGQDEFIENQWYLQRLLVWKLAIVFSDIVQFISISQSKKVTVLFANIMSIICMCVQK